MDPIVNFVRSVTEDNKRYSDFLFKIQALSGLSNQELKPILSEVFENTTDFDYIIRYYKRNCKFPIKQTDMKEIIKQIEKIKGVKTVEPAGENMAVVVFEAEQPESLSVDELVDGGIYVDEGDEEFKYRIIRFKAIKSSNSIILISQLICGKEYYFGAENYHFGKYIRQATPAEKQTLIRAEIEHGYFHELR